MKCFCLCLLAFCFTQSVAQVFSVDEIISSDSSRRFWVIRSGQHTDAARKINAVLQSDWGYDPGLGDPFENMAAEDDFYDEVAANNDRVFSVVLEASHSGCGLHITRRSYNFDSKTGAAIDMNKLFGADGHVKIRKALYKSWRAALKSAAAGDDRADEYKACLVEAEKISEIDVGRLMITDRGIKFWAGSCLEGTAYDFNADRSQGPHEYSFAQLLPMLTPYGYTLFADRLSGPVQNLLRGTIDGKYPISLTILPGKTADTITGMIVYDRVGQPINLSGTMNGNQFVIHELDEKNNPLSDIEVSWDGTKLTGSFVNLKSRKQMPFVASAVK